MLGAILGASFCTPALAQTTWTGAGGNTSWNNAANWDSASVPNGATVDVTVGTPSPTDLDISVALQSLQIDAGGVVNVLGFRSLDFSGTAAQSLANAGTINLSNGSTLEFRMGVNNSGNIQVNSLGNLTNIDVVGTSVLSGGGTISLNNANTQIRGVGAGAELIIQDQTISGFGNIGGNSLIIENGTNGVITANSNGNVLTIDPSTTMTNTGVLQSENGGILALAGGDYLNSGGSISALDGSSVRLANGVNITGGVLSTSGSGEIRAENSMNVFLSDVTNQGLVIAGNNSDLGISGTITNSGEIRLTSFGNTTDLEIQAGGATLTGGGILRMEATTTGINGFGTLTIANQTIEGSGAIGQNTIGIINQTGGVINANISGETLTLDPNADGFVNEGVLQASSGGTLLFNAGDYANLGSIAALQDSTVRFANNASVSGGTLSTSGNGQMLVNSSSNVFLSDLTTQGLIIAENNSDLGVSGTITNTGEIRLASFGNTTDLEIQTGGATLTGGGTVRMAAAATGINGFGTLTIANQTIEGTGDIGRNTIGIVNESGGFINANVSGETLILDPNADGLTNFGTMQASAGGTLRFNSGDYFNSGTISALQDSTVRFVTGASVTGGTLSTSGNGQMLIDPSANVFFTDLTTQGLVIAGNNSDLGISGTITNSGEIQLASIGNTTDLEVQTGGATLSGGGTLRLTSTAAGINGFGTLTIADQTIEGFGAIGRNVIGIVNQAGGIINANVASTDLFIDASAAGLTNEGTFTASNGGTLVISDASFTNNGDVIAQTGSFIEASTIVNATDGLLAGNGTIDANITNFGEIAPGASPGTLTIAGNLDMESTSLFSIEIAGNALGEFDLLNVTGTWDLDGILAVTLDGYTPLSSDVFLIGMSGSPLTGSFANVANGGQLTVTNGTGIFDVGYSGSSIQLSNFQITSVPEPSGLLTLAVVAAFTGWRRRCRIS